MPIGMEEYESDAEKMARLRAERDGAIQAGADVARRCAKAWDENAKLTEKVATLETALREEIRVIEEYRRGSTHYDGCWKEHRLCAAVKRMSDALAPETKVDPKQYHPTDRAEGAPCRHCQKSLGYHYQTAKGYLFCEAPREMGAEPLTADQQHDLMESDTKKGRR
jgi:hypothetical protein